MLITPSVKSKIERIISSIEHDYQITQGLILTEDDLKCLIFDSLKALFQPKIHILLPSNVLGKTSSDTLNWRMKTLDQEVYASPVHAEIPWYDERQRLAIIPDITILEPSELSILHGYDGPTLPSKQCEFGGQGIIFELKFIRKKVGIDKDSLGNINRVLSISEMGHFLNRTLWHNQAALTSSLRPWL